jgi:hypothetical protein
VHGASNIQGFMHQRFGRIGTGSFNLLVGVRLVSEVFANLLVVGIVFGATGSLAYTVAILAVAGVTLGYSMLGGLHASLRTDVLQFGILTALLILLFGMMLLAPEFLPGAILASSPDLVSPGWILLLVALIQVPSYPLHDPVMMDRGFLADRVTTRRSFLHAFWISALLILAFGLLGVFAGLHRTGGEEFLDTLTRLLGQPAALLLGIALVVSAASTMDSTFASTAKLAVIDMKLGRRSNAHGRAAMALFAAAGLLMVFFGTRDLFAAVAVSGTAAMFLTPGHRLEHRTRPPGGSCGTGNRRRGIRARGRAVFPGKLRPCRLGRGTDRRGPQLQQTAAAQSSGARDGHGSLRSGRSRPDPKSVKRCNAWTFIGMVDARRCCGGIKAPMRTVPVRTPTFHTSSFTHRSRPCCQEPSPLSLPSSASPRPFTPSQSPMA